MLVLIANKKKAKRRKLKEDVNLESQKNLIGVTQYIYRRENISKSDQIFQLFLLCPFMSLRMMTAYVCVCVHIEIRRYVLMYVYRHIMYLYIKAKEED